MMLRHAGAGTVPEKSLPASSCMAPGNRQAPWLPLPRYRLIPFTGDKNAVRALSPAAARLPQSSFLRSHYRRNRTGSP